MESVEILTSAWCPLNCRYCYIPKTPYMKEMHENVKGEIRNFLEEVRLRKVPYISFWGTEPLTTIMDIDIDSFYHDKLQSVSFSTSLLYHPELLVKWIDKVRPRNLSLKVQVSLDGPSFITDRNRAKGASSKIPRNLMDIVEDLNRINLGRTRVEFTFKPTLTIENLEGLIENPTLIEEYVGYFRSIECDFKNTNRNKNVVLRYGSYSPTMMVPGKYTSTDGKIFARFVKLSYEKGLKTSYHFRLRRLYDFAYELHKKRMFTCSGGDSNFGYDGKWHICHRSFYLNRESYVRSVLETDIENWDVSLFETGKINLVRRYITSDETGLKYVLRGHHDFWKLGISSVVARLKELVACNQISSTYGSDEMATRFAIFSQSCIDCPMENLLNTGSIHIVPVSLIRLFCNGAFEEIDRRVRNELRI